MQISGEGSTPKIEEDIDKELGRVISVLGYPLTIIRDTVGQFDYDAAGSTYNRDLGYTPSRSR